MPQILFRNLNLLDPRWNEARGGYEVLVEGDLIKEVSSKPIKAAKAKVVDCGKRTLMPGLIDCHVHVFLVEVNFRLLESMPLTLLTARSADLMKGMIDRGFTTVRDTGGADWGIKTAVDSGLIPGPRLFISGRAIGPTGGHSDSRRRTDIAGAPCGCCNAMVYSLAIADGPDAVRKAVREQMRQGADQVKIMCSGGVASPYDPLDSLQFSEAEIAAATDEAKNFGRYVLAHAYSPEAITRAVNNGVRTIEHGNLIDAKSAKLLKSKGGYMVANLVTYFVMKEKAAQFGMTADMLEKNDIVLDGALALARNLQGCRREGGLRQRSFGPAPGRTEPRVHVPRRGAEAAGDHPAGHHRRRRDPAPGGQARHRRARRLRRPDRGRRQSAEKARAVPRPGRPSAGDHEGRQVPQERVEIGL